MKGIVIYFRFVVVAIVFVVSIVEPAKAQSNCSQVLSDAIRKFEAGQLNEIEDFVSSCLRSGFTKNEKIQALRLLTLVHLYQDDKQNAEESFLKMLVLNKEFIIDTKSDPSELIYLAGLYRIRPVFTIQGRAGANYTMPNVINRYTFSSNDSSIEKYTPSISFKVSGAVEYTFWKYFQGGLEASFSYAGFTYLNNLDNKTTVEFKESQSWVDIPMYLKFGVPIKLYTPYIYGGASYSFLITDQASNLSNDYNDDKSFKGPNVDLLDLRKGYNFSMFAGLGLKKKLGTDYLVFDVRYTKGLSNLVKMGTRYDMNIESGRTMANDFSYLDPDFSINQIAFTVGYIKSIYKPKKLNKN